MRATPGSSWSSPKSCRKGRGAPRTSAGRPTTPTSSSASSASATGSSSRSSLTSMCRIAVLGYIVRGPLGGLVWHHLQYVTGLRALGHDVLFVEDSDDYPSCYDPSRHVVDTDPSYGLRFAAETFGRAGVGDLWAFHDAHTGRWLGPAAGRARAFCESADLVLNLSGVNPLRDWV